MQIPFITVDVFTDRKFGGNPLAVVPDATPLTGAQMQAIAGEFNLAETTFVLPPQDPAHTAEVRIFTPRAELPFAGHPNIGTAYVLAKERERQGRAVSDPMIFEEKAGLVRLSLMKEGAAVVGARLAPPQSLARGDDIDDRHHRCGLFAGGERHRNCQSSALHRLLRHSLRLRGIKNPAGAGGRAAAYGALHQTPASRSRDRSAALRQGSKRRIRSSGAHVRAALRRSPKTRRRAAAMSHWPDCWRASAPKPISSFTCASARASTWAGQVCSKPAPRNATARLPRCRSAAAVCR